MDKKVVIISASLRKDSNSERLAKAFAQGAERAENEIEFISLSGKKTGILYRVSVLSENVPLLYAGRCGSHCRKDKKCRCGGICYADLLLRDKWSVENFVGPVQSHIPTGIQVQGCISSYGGSR